MNQSSGFILVIIGLLLLYTVITGKFAILENAFNQLFELEAKPLQQATGGVTGKTETKLPDIGINSSITLPGIFIPEYVK